MATKVNISDIVFDTFVICPLCGKKMKSITSSHLQHKHGYNDLQEFKIEYGIPMKIPLVANEVVAMMRKHGQRRSQWFRKNVMPIGIEQSRKNDLVPKKLRKHSAAIRKGKSWIPQHKENMRSEGWLDIHESARLLNISYNYARKCATDGRLKTVNIKGIRFSRHEWVAQTELLLIDNRIKYHKPERIKSDK
jgi:hypothetical protein